MRKKPQLKLVKRLHRVKKKKKQRKKRKQINKNRNLIKKRINRSRKRRKNRNRKRTVLSRTDSGWWIIMLWTMDLVSIILVTTRTVWITISNNCITSNSPVFRGNCRSKCRNKRGSDNRRWNWMIMNSTPSNIWETWCLNTWTRNVPKSTRRRKPARIPWNISLPWSSLKKRWTK